MQNHWQLPEMVGTGPELQPLADRVSGAWLAFARTGNPSHPGIPTMAGVHRDRASTMHMNNEWARGERSGPRRAPRAGAAAAAADVLREVLAAENPRLIRLRSGERIVRRLAATMAHGQDENRREGFSPTRRAVPSHGGAAPAALRARTQAQCPAGRTIDFRASDDTRRRWGRGARAPMPLASVVARSRSRSSIRVEGAAPGSAWRHRRELTCCAGGGSCPTQGAWSPRMLSTRWAVSG